MNGTAAGYEKTFPFESKLILNPGAGNENRVMNVFCFHHAGGTAASYRKWTTKLLPVRIICVELMGKGTRRGEPFIGNSKMLAQTLAQQIKAKTGSAPFCLFGHSMGAVLAFEVCCILERLYGVKPEKLIVAGRQAPQDENRSEFKTYMDDQALIEELRRYQLTPEDVLQNEQFMSYYLPEIRRDYQLSESFCYNGERTDVPVIAHAALKDAGADRKMMKRWKEVTTNHFEIREFKGNHFFVLEDESYLAALAEDVMK